MRKVIFLSIILFFTKDLYSQDFWDDANGDGIILQRINKTILSTRLNVGDNSLKINFNLRINPDTIGDKEQIIDLPSNEKDIIDTSTKNFWGLGGYSKLKIENNLGSIFSGGSIVPSVVLGGYISYEWHNNNLRIIKGKDLSKGSKFSWLVLRGEYKNANYSIYDSTLNSNMKIYDTVFNGFSFSLSFVHLFSINEVTIADRSLKKIDDMILGCGIKMSNKNTYQSMQKVKIDDIKALIDTTNGNIRNITYLKDEDTYAEGKYEQFNVYTVKAIMGYIPNFLSNRISFLLYPSIDYSKFKPEYNCGLSICFLNEKDRMVSDASIYVELKDLTNSTNSKQKFTDRTIRVGVTGTINTIFN